MKKSYHFNCGNSTTGAVGFCARVTASSKLEACRILNAAFDAPSFGEIALEMGGRVEYGNVYLGKVKPSDIDEINRES